MTITDILAIKFVGNHADDADTFHVIEFFILRPDVSFPDKRAALQHYSKKGMGLPEEVSAVDVFTFIASLQD